MRLSTEFTSLHLKYTDNGTFSFGQGSKRMVEVLSAATDFQFELKSDCSTSGATAPELIFPPGTATMKRRSGFRSAWHNGKLPVVRRQRPRKCPEGELYCEEPADCRVRPAGCSVHLCCRVLRPDEQPARCSAGSRCLHGTECRHAHAEPERDPAAGGNNSPSVIAAELF